MKNTQSKIKPIKTRREIGTMYCLGCKDYFKSQGKKMTNKVLWKKSNYAVCRSSKSRFLKQKHNNKKQSNAFFKLQKHEYLLQIL